MVMHRKATKAEHMALLLNYLFFFVLMVCMLVPILLLVSKSFSSERAILSGTVGVLPDFLDMHVDSYRYVLQNKSFMQGFVNTVLVTVIGSGFAIVVTAMAGYALSKPYVKGRKLMLMICIFTMIFSGGLIPTYLIMGLLGLVNTFHILWIAGIFSTANMLILKNSFESVPKELEEAAVIDGAGHLSVLFRVYLPVSKAPLAVITLFYAVDYWNNYYTSMIYTTRATLKTLQVVLKDIIFSASDVFLGLNTAHSLGEVTAQSTVAASVVIATIPILLAYPFLQKHFSKGVLIGSVKG